VRKPGKKATKEQKAAYRQAKKTHNLNRSQNLFITFEYSVME